MSKYLGLDLGKNSIGWALVDNHKIIDKGVQIFTNSQRTEKRGLRRKNQRELILLNRISEKNTTLFKIKNLLIKNIRIILLSIITLTLFLFSLIFAEFWQLFLNLGVGGLISILTLEKNKKI
ncbi:hypothetical protein [Corallibacter sp.]|uniref:hypothetical protein n=1 Tax=Corallibacter sp. TaxID=2038084 RepID=UPI003A91D690